MDSAKPSELDVTSRESKSISLLPRSAWRSEVTKLRLLLQTKQFIDRQYERLAQ